MKVNGKVYLSGMTPKDTKFVLVDIHRVKPNVTYYITEHGEFEMYDSSGIREVYAYEASANGLLDDYMYDHEPEVDIIELTGSEIIELAGDKLNTFHKVFYAYERQQKGEK